MLIHERTTAATAERVWDYLSDLENWAQLLPTVDTVDRLDHGPITIGSRFHVVQPGLAPAQFVVTDWRPGSGFTWQSRLPGVITTAIHELTRQGDRTHLRIGIGWSGPLSRPIRLVLSRKVRRLLALEADTLVKLAERGPDPR